MTRPLRHRGLYEQNRRQAGLLIRSAAGLLASLAVPVLLYYVLRALGVSIYVALLVTSGLTAVPSLYQLARRRTVGKNALYFSAVSVAALVIALLP